MKDKEHVKLATFSKMNSYYYLLNCSLHHNYELQRKIQYILIALMVKFGWLEK